MQTLYFEPAWDKTIAPADREKISTRFQSLSLDEGIHFSFLWEAINHKGEQLITVLIHNVEDTPLTLEDTVISYCKDEKMTTGIFTIPVMIPEKTSMPWTLIFSPSNQTSQTPTYIVTNEK